jgi:ubiquinone/menaquinone biosynthesis C-methylase UbiE
VKDRIILQRIPGPLAPLYEKATRMAIEGYYRRIAGEIASHLKEGIILDLGTGPGYLPIEIARMSPAVRVVGIDLGRTLIKMARANAVKAGVADRVDFRTGNAAGLGFGDGTYDMVVSTGMLHALKSPLKVLRECYRVLKLGGEAWVYDPAQVSSRIDVKAWKASLTPLEKFLYGVFMLYSRFSPGHTYTGREVAAMIRETDFRSYSIEEWGKELRIKLRK